MKSFIRSHRYSNSEENDHSISKHSYTTFSNPSVTNFQENLNCFNSPKKIRPQEFSTPPPSVHNLYHASPSKHSPTFESFHKLANKTQKLFKKTSTSNLCSSSYLTANTNSSSIVVTNVSSKVNNDSFDHKSKGQISLSSLSGFDKYDSGVDDIPAIKGTIVHSWGSSNKRSSTEYDNSLSMTISNNGKNVNTNGTRSEDHVIYLNTCNNDSNEPLTGDNNNNFGNLSPPVNISGRSSVIVNEIGKNYFNKDQLSVSSTQYSTDKELDESSNVPSGLNMPKVRSAHVSKEQKYKNRKARIHSNEDLLSLQAAIGDDRELNGKPTQKPDTPLVKNSLVLPSIIIQKPVTSGRLMVLEDNNDGDKGSNSEGESESGNESESESDVSEFSFEYSRLNGRTSSVKYYSKPEDEKRAINNGKVYINDIYEDENFDEDMNYDDGDDIDDLDYNFYGVTGNNTEHIELNNNNKSDDNIVVINKKLTTMKKPITKYSDLFDETSSNNDDDIEDSTFKNMKCIDNISITQPVIESSHRVNSYNDLFDISDNDDIKNKNGCDSDIMMKGNREHNNKQQNNDHVNLVNGIFKNNYTNNNSNSLMDFESTKSDHFLSKNGNVEQNYVNLKNIEVNSVQVKSTATSNHQLRSFDDLFHISDGEEEGNSEIQNEDNDRTVIETMQSDPCHAIEDQENPFVINSNIPSILEETKISKSFELKDNKGKNITKYSDLFDLSDDEAINDSVDDVALYVNQESSLNSPINSISDDRGMRTCLSNPTNIWDRNQTSKLPLLITTNANSQLFSVKPIKKPFIRSYRSFPVLSDDYNDETDTENESLTPLTSHLDILSPLNSRQFTPIKNMPLSPTPSNNKNKSVQTHTNILSSQPLPPTTRSRILKYYDLNSNLDSEVPGLTSTLYFIDEAEEDEYNNNNKEKHGFEDDGYTYDLDEINKVPEDFEFSEEEVARGGSKYFRTAFGSPLSFRRIHSYYSKPTGVPRGDTPLSNRIEINNKTVTFFNRNWSNNTTNNLSVLNYGSVESRTPPSRSPLTSPSKMDKNNSKFFSNLSPVNAINSQYSLSPIQESTSVTNSPERT